MDSRAVTEEIAQNTFLQQCVAALQKGEDLLLEELWEGPLASCAHLVSSHYQNIVIITSDKPQNHFFDDLSYFSKESILEFPSWEVMPSDIAQQKEAVQPTCDVMGT